MQKTEYKTKFDETKGELVMIPCATCKNQTRHLVTGSLDVSGTQYDDAEEWSVDWLDNYQILQCQGCHSASFRHKSWFSEWEDDGVTERLYPKRSLNGIEAKPFYNVPTGLRRIYAELIDCFNNESSTLCAAGLRALVEGICEEQGVVDGPVVVQGKNGLKRVNRENNLAAKIYGLEEKNLLTKAAANTLHSHRYLGNDAVHQLARPAEGELRLAIEIVELTLENLYELPEKAKELSQAMAKRKR